jgi:two-component system NarL family sensor kinase
MPEEKSAIIQIVIVGSIILALVAIFIVSFMFLYTKRHNRYLMEKKEMQSQFQQELLRTQMEIQEQTFKTISQEIHDNIGQMLSLAKMNLSKFEIDRLNSDEAVLSAKELVSQSVSSLRDLSKTLNTDTITTIGLIKSIELELQLVEKTAGVRTNMNVISGQQKLQPQQELILFRIIQEALHNSIKHASPKLLTVDANFENNSLQLTICDDGNGFDSLNIKTEGSGLRNMQSRSKLIGADWKLESTPGKGTKILITIPTNQRHDNYSTGR